MVSKGVQFGVVGAVAFLVVGVVMPRVLGGKQPTSDVTVARNTRALGPGAPWRIEEDRGLAKRLHDAEPDLTPIAVWSCSTLACGFQGRYMVLAGPDRELPRPRLEALLDLAAQPIKADQDWPAFPDTQAQGFRYPQRLFYVISQSDRRPGAAAAMIAGELIDEIAIRAGQSEAPVRETSDKADRQGEDQPASDPSSTGALARNAK